MSHETLLPRLDAVRHGGRFDAEIIERFATFLEKAPDEELFRSSPYRFAERAGVAPRQAIDLFLHATHAGILDFAWGVLCPGCSSFLTTRGALRSLKVGRECRLCSVAIRTSLDDNTEVAFTVSPQVRRIRFHGSDGADTLEDAFRVMFSTSKEFDAESRGRLFGAMFATSRALAGATTTIEFDLDPGLFLAIAPRQHAVLRFETREGAPQEAELDLLEGRFLPDTLTLAPGRVRLHIRNRLHEPHLVTVIRDFVTPLRLKGAPPPHRLLRYLTGKELVTSQTFRELFRAESIPSEGGLELKNLTVLFTDLKDSTALYNRVGDFAAFGLVRDHFGLLREVVASRGGAVVKTIGDAIMASFPEPAPALDAAFAMNRELRAQDRGLSLKIGLHAGPAIAVELNERLDYFGQTVNVAARVQGLAGADEVVCTDAVLGADGAADLVRAQGLVPRTEAARLKGVEGVVTVHRLG